MVAECIVSFFLGFCRPSTGVVNVVAVGCLVGAVLARVHLALPLLPQAAWKRWFVGAGGTMGACSAFLLACVLPVR